MLASINEWATFLPARHSKRRLCYGNVAGWLAVCHGRYCIKTTKI